MKKSKKFLCLILAMVILIPNIAIFGNVFAQTADSEPLKIEVTTDKSSDTTYGIAEITVKVTNTSDEAVNNISAEAVFEQLAPVGKNNETFKEVESLQSGESFIFSYKATLNANKVNINFFEKIILWFVRLFNGGYNATSHNIEAVTEDITEIKFGNYIVENVVKVEYTEVNRDMKTYEELIKNVDIDKKYERKDENVSVDSSSGTTYVNNIIMIMFDSDCSNERKAELINSINGKVVGGISGYDELHIEIENSTLEELEEICDLLNENEDIYATYDKAIYNVSSIPNDLYNPYNQGDFVDWENEFESSAYNWSAVAVDAPGAWDYNHYYNTINIGVVDNGFSSNKDLENLRIISSENSPEAHGTEVTGIIGATANNKIGIAGMVWNKNIYAYDAQKSNSQVMYESDTYDGVELLVKQGCKVINLSLGVAKKQMTQKEINDTGKNASKKMAKLLEKGYDFVIVQAAGNGDSNGKGMNAINNGKFCSITKDNCYSSEKVTVDDIMNRIIVVASAERNCETKSYSFAVDSNGGNQVDIAAPGVGVLTTTASTEYPYKLSAGTSIAAPFVTSVASLVWSVNSSFTGKEVVEIVLKSAEEGKVIVENNATSPTTNKIYMVNAKLAVEEAIERTNKKITGTVKDGTTNEATSNLVTIKLKDGDNNIVSHGKADKNGSFSVNVPSGEYTVLIECEGYVSYSTTVTVKNKGIDLGEVLLNPNIPDDSGIFEGGNGTKANPYQVSTPEQLDAVRNNLSAHYIQIADIDMSDWGNWEPIGGPDNSVYGVIETYSTPFSGNYNGNNYEIGNLSIKNNQLSYAGLFGGTKNSTISNIKLTNLQIEIDKDYFDFYEYHKNISSNSLYFYCGGISAYSYECNIDNCFTSGTIIVENCEKSSIGGIVGGAEKCTITDCINKVTISSQATKEAYKLNGTYFSSEIYCGGIVGISRNNVVSNCINYGNIEVTANFRLYLGGVEGNSNSTVSNCANYGVLKGYTIGCPLLIPGSSGDTNIGGIIGVCDGKIINCKNYGNLYGFANVGNSQYRWSRYLSYVGGISGFSSYGEIENCYNYCSVIESYYFSDETDSQYVHDSAGRILAYYLSYTDISNCYSVETTTINSYIPTDEIGLNLKNGENLIE